MDIDVRKCDHEPAAQWTGSKAVFVVGMHRSGTSALTGILNLLGVDLGTSLMPPAENNNETGFWEHEEIVNVHDNIFYALGSLWDDWRPLPQNWESHEDIRRFRQQLCEIIDRDFSRSPLWAVKDPRLCRLLPIWTDILQERSVHPLFIIMLRNPLEVAASLRDRDQMEPEEAYALWLKYVIESERWTRNEHRMVISYDHLVGDWRQVISRIQHELGADWPVPMGAGERDIDGFLQPRLRHHKVSEGHLVHEGHGAGGPLVKLFEQWVNDESEGKDPIGNMFRETVSDLSGVMDIYERLAAKLEEQIHERDSAIAVIHGADEPLSRQVSTVSRELTVRGWCFGGSRRTISSVQAVVNGEIVAGVYGLERSDLSERYPGVGGPTDCGFEVCVPLEAGTQTVVIEAMDVNGVAHRIRTLSVTAPVAPLLARIDTPENFRHVEGKVRFSGWCLHPEQRIEKLTLLYAGARAECLYGIGREDVGKAFPRSEYSRNSGFEATFALEPCVDELVIEARLESGETLQLRTGTIYSIYRTPLRKRIASNLASVGRFAQFGIGAAKQWRMRNGRLPTVGEIPELSRKALARYRGESPQALDPGATPPHFRLPQRVDPYDAWVAVNQWNERADLALRERLDRHSGMLPKISVIMPVYNPPLKYLHRAIESVVEQVYQGWELCIADDASTDPGIKGVLAEWAQKDHRIKYVLLEENGNISRATNAAAGLAVGDFLCFLDNDDELTPDALGEVAIYVAEHPDTDYLYTDDDKIDEKGHRVAPQFKPDWSPELLLSYMYCSHLVGVRRSLYDKIGGMREGYEGSQDYDFALRATEQSRHVGHIPLVLYHWRVLPGSTSTAGDAKPDSFKVGQRAVQEALDRRGVRGVVNQPLWAARGKLGIFQPEFPDDGPSVTIVIPTKNQLKLIRRCIESLRSTTYVNYEVLVVDNGSDDAKTLHYLSGCGHRVVTIPNQGDRFSFAYINNRAVEYAKTEYVLFLNNDTEVRAPQWLSRMMGYAQMEGVGAVGARLLFPDGRIQHAGIVHGLYHGMAGPAFKLLDARDHGYLSYASVTRNYSAVTAACLLTPKRLFVELGGFDEKDFSVAYNDVDYCYRLVENRYRCVYTPGAELIHHEGATRGFSDNPSEEAAFRSKYGHRGDPWYSPHLSLSNERFQIAPRRVTVGRKGGIRAFMTAFNLNLEGAPYSQYELTKGLKEKGVIDPIVFCPTDGPLRALYEGDGVRVLIDEHPLAGVFTEKGYDKAIDTFARYIKEQNVEVVYANTLQTFYAIAAAERAGIPSIWNPRESEPWQGYFSHFGVGISRRALECFRYPYRVVFVADATREGYEPLNSQHNFMVIHNGLDLDRLEKSAAKWPRESARKSLGVGEGQVVIVLIGTVCERKGQHDLPKALAALPEELHSSVRCFIVGDRPGQYSSELKALVDDLPEGLRAGLQIVSETDDTARYYRAADIFVCTSRIESYPRVILEAMAYRLPIVTTPVYGIKEQVREGVNGVCYTPGEAGTLAHLLQKLIRDREYRRMLAENSQYVLRTLEDLDSMVSGYAKVFEETYFSQRP